MELTALPAFTDNYIWMLSDGRDAVVVDPGQAEPVLAALQQRGLSLRGILVTHHHGDHVGGIAALRPLLDGQVWGPANEHIPEPFTPLREGQRLQLLGLDIEVMDVPGHTAGHIAYVIRQPAAGQSPLLFCGDTLFSGGCGRLFEGTPAQMQDSLARLSALAADTRVCCTHEYTLANLRFAREIEPDNRALAEYQVWCEAQRAQGQPTLPSRLGLELQINPFLRCAEPSVQAAARRHASFSALEPSAAGELQAPAAPSLAVFAALRQWKNDYR
ncbi:hydroxyacylglutathione hydrolase [Paucibacter sp. DJ1R-11]|uniref:hydroxyacylglutathione hydrolase n=1 Tax=Paucibacter sp. DJ1R-11 TaxID=2893556 RepID=UPI0021E4D3AF|nr:hydroxyacylglutathione hydrolase [Paucibacter sp. DJ1R-11]MCV2364247.1 hydroxyacylglutathione hydrolase [Paucibacter sp. DJ1R-11]